MKRVIADSRKLSGRCIRGEGSTRRGTGNDVDATRKSGAAYELKFLWSASSLRSDHDLEVDQSIHLRLLSLTYP